MVAAWRRALAGAGLALCGALFAGCHASGTFEVLSEDRVRVDLVVSGDVTCPNAVDSLKLTITATQTDSGERACHVTGETQATYFSPFGIDVSRAAEYLVLQTNLSGGTDEWPSSDIELRFPGQVVTATRGEVVGNGVRITDLDELANGSGLRVVAIDRPGPPDWVIAAVVGTGTGVVLTLSALGLVLLSRRQRPARDGIVLEPAGDDPPAGEPAAIPPPRTDAAASRTVHGMGKPLPQAFAAAPGAGPPASDDGPDPGPGDTAWFAVPPAGHDQGGGSSIDPASPLSPPVRASGEPTTDHSVWAPPEDRQGPAG